MLFNRNGMYADGRDEWPKKVGVKTWKIDFVLSMTSIWPCML